MLIVENESDISSVALKTTFPEEMFWLSDMDDTVSDAQVDAIFSAAAALRQEACIHD